MSLGSPIGAVVWLTNGPDTANALPRPVRSVSHSPRGRWLDSEHEAPEPNAERLRAWAKGLRQAGCDPVLLIAAGAPPDSALVWVQHRRPEFGMVSAIATALSWASDRDMVIAAATGEVVDADEIEHRVRTLLMARAELMPTEPDTVIIWEDGVGPTTARGEPNPAGETAEATEHTATTALSALVGSVGAEGIVGPVSLRDGSAMAMSTAEPSVDLPARGDGLGRWVHHGLGTVDGAVWPSSWRRALWSAIQHGDLEPLMRQWSTNCLSIGEAGDLS